MLDTTNYIYRDYSTGTNLMRELPRYFEVLGEHSYINGTVLTGNLDTLSLSVGTNYIKIKNSLCKWYLGDNFQTLTKGDIKRANEKLSDILHIDINKSNVSRIDIATNLIMQHPIKVYYDYLGDLSRYKRLEQPDGLYYKTKNKTLLFYDKVKEQKAKGEFIPEIYQNSNLLRFEMRYTNNLSKELKQQEITAELLTKEPFYNQLIKNYNQMYKAINKEKEINLSVGDMKGIKGLNNTGVLLLIKEFGEVEITKQIKNDFIQGKISEKEKRGMLDKIKSLRTKTDIMKESDLIKELDSKIRTATRFYL